MMKTDAKCAECIGKLYRFDVRTEPIARGCLSQAAAYAMTDVGCGNCTRETQMSCQSKITGEYDAANRLILVLLPGPGASVRQTTNVVIKSL